jgi:hypothetical protein
VRLVKILMKAVGEAKKGSQHSKKICKMGSFLMAVSQSAKLNRGVKVHLVAKSRLSA